MDNYSLSEPEPNPEEEPEPQPEAEKPGSGAGVSEPVPNWPSATQEWSFGWELHTYGIGSIYAVFTILCIAVLIRSCVRKTHLVPPYATCVRILLLVFGLLRSVCLFTDAYNHTSFFPSLVYYLLWIIAEPCLLSSFSIYFLVLQEATQFRPSRKKFRVQQPRVLIGIVITHFVIAILSPVLFHFTASVGHVFQIICGSYYILIGICVVACFSYLAQNLQGHYNRMRNGFLLKTSLKEDMRALLKILLHVYLLIASGIVLSVLHLYGLLGVYKVLATDDTNIYIEPWSWWIYQTVARLVELLIGFVLFQAVNNNRKIKKKMQTIKSRLDSSTSTIKQKHTVHDDVTSLNQADDGHIKQQQSEKIVSDDKNFV